VPVCARTTVSGIDYNETGVIRDAGNTNAVIRSGRDDSGHMCTMAVGVGDGGGTGLVGFRVVGGKDVVLQVDMPDCASRVDDGDGNAVCAGRALGGLACLGDAPGLVGVQGVKCPLVSAVGVIDGDGRVGLDVRQRAYFCFRR